MKFSDLFVVVHEREIHIISIRLAVKGRVHIFYVSCFRNAAFVCRFGEHVMYVCMCSFITLWT